MQVPAILAFDTSGPHCSAAVLLEGEVAARRDQAMTRGQAERLFPLLEDALSEAGLGWKDIGGFGVGIGPGNFTGIRISVAAARGLSLSLGVPAVGVSNLRALAVGTEYGAIAAIDARQDRLYAQVFASGHRSVPVLCTLDTLPPVPSGAAPVAVGHRAEEIAARLGLAESRTAPQIAVSEAIARLAAEDLAGGGAVSRPAPLYIRPADAAPSKEAGPRIVP